MAAAEARGAGMDASAQIQQKPAVQPVLYITPQERRELSKQARLAKQAQQREAELQHTESVATSHRSIASWIQELPDAPVFHPTPEQFADPIAYIRSIQGCAAKYGACRIVPPCMPTTPAVKVLAQGAAGGAPGGKFTFTARAQPRGKLNWASFDSGRFLQTAKRYTVDGFEAAATCFSRKTFGTSAVMPPRMVEAEYWRLKAQPANTASTREMDWVLYGNDVEGSAFSDAPSDPLASSAWNLKVLPRLPGSLLRHLRGDIPGVTSPMLYVGSLFASFAWHVEDHCLYSINYHHIGAPKTWYCVPASHADGFEAAVLEEVYGQAASSARAAGLPEDAVVAAGLGALLDKTTIVSPGALMRRGVAVFRAVQQPGEFVVTFPRSYHGGFSNGFNLGEAVNFATPDWLPYGLECSARYRRLRRGQMLLHEQLLLTEALAVLQGLGGDEQQLQQLLACQPAPAAAPGGAPTPAAATTLRSFCRLLRWQHENRLQLTRQLHAAGAACSCQALPACLTGSLRCDICADHPGLAAVLPPPGADGVLAVAEQGAPCAVSSSSSAASSSSRGREQAGGGSEAATATGSKRRSSASSSKRRLTPAAAGAAAAAAAAAPSSDAAAAAAGAAAPRSSCNNSGVGDSGGGRAGGGAFDCGVLCLRCALAAVASACDLSSWGGCVVLVARQIQELEQHARRLEPLVAAPVGAESALGSDGLTEGLRFGAEPVAAVDLTQPGMWQPDAPGMLPDSHASQLHQQAAAPAAAAVASNGGRSSASVPSLEQLQLAAAAQAAAAAELLEASAAAGSGDADGGGFDAAAGAAHAAATAAAAMAAAAAAHATDVQASALQRESPDQQQPQQQEQPPHPWGSDVLPDVRPKRDRRDADQQRCAPAVVEPPPHKRPCHAPQQQLLQPAADAAALAAEPAMEAASAACADAAATCAVAGAAAGATAAAGHDDGSAVLQQQMSTAAGRSQLLAELLTQMPPAQAQRAVAAAAVAAGMVPGLAAGANAAGEASAGSPLSGATSTSTAVHSPRAAATAAAVAVVPLPASNAAVLSQNQQQQLHQYQQHQQHQQLLHQYQQQQQHQYQQHHQYQQQQQQQQLACMTRSPHSLQAVAAAEPAALPPGADDRRLFASLLRDWGGSEQDLQAATYAQQQQQQPPAGMAMGAPSGGCMLAAAAGQGMQQHAAQLQREGSQLQEQQRAARLQQLQQEQSLLQLQQAQLQHQRHQELWQ